MNEHKDIIQQMYEKICDFVSQTPWIEKELLEMERAFFWLSMEKSGLNPGMLFFDWFLFDYTLKKNGKRLFDVFLAHQKNKIPPDLLVLYASIGDDHFGFFKVNAVRMGKEFSCTDLSTKKEYHVIETSFSRHITKGDYFVGRILPFKDAFVLASQCVYFPKQEYDLVSMVLKKAAHLPATKRLDAFETYKTFFPLTEPEKLSYEEKFNLLCKEGGLSDDDIEDILLDASCAIKSKEIISAQQMVKRVMDKMTLPSHFDPEEFLECYIHVWNSLVGKIHSEAQKGPIEISLINASLTLAQQKFPRPENMDEKQAARLCAKTQKWCDQWFITPQRELKDKSPKEVIMEERQKLGNPQKEFGFQVNIELVSRLNRQQEEQTDELAGKAAERMNQQAYQDALDYYQQYLEIWDGNHVVWHNMAVCYVMLLQKRKAEKCLEKAITIKPDYKLAVKKLDELLGMYKEDMVAMVKAIKESRR